MAVHCPECGFVNPEGANYCQKCGAFLGEATKGDTTEVYQVDETGEIRPVDLEEVTGEGATHGRVLCVDRGELLESGH